MGLGLYSLPGICQVRIESLVLLLVVVRSSTPPLSTCKTNRYDDPLLALYCGAMLYLLHPLYPAIDSTHLIQLVSELPTWAKVSGKFILALPFTFHSFNGIRHLVWDMNKGEFSPVLLGDDDGSVLS